MEVCHFGSFISDQHVGSMEKALNALNIWLNKVKYINIDVKEIMKGKIIIV